MRVATRENDVEFGLIVARLYIGYALEVYYSCILVEIEEFVVKVVNLIIIMS